jgi:hypothetical protein
MRREAVKRTGTVTSCIIFSRLCFCFSSRPSRTRFEALSRSCARTIFSPRPSFEFPASSKMRPSMAFFRRAEVRPSSGFNEPESSCVCTKRCSSASFCALVLVNVSWLKSKCNVADAHSSSSSSSVASAVPFPLCSCVSSLSLDTLEDLGRGKVKAARKKKRTHHECLAL